MPRTSAGLLMYRNSPQGLQVLLVHPGGPFWKKKDVGVWSIPKGEPEPGEELLAAAIREFTEEIGAAPGEQSFIELTPIKQKGGKIVHAWALAGNLDTTMVASNLIEIQWPPRSGKTMQIPEVDRAEFFELAAARIKINPAQVPLIDQLDQRLSGGPTR